MVKLCKSFQASEEYIQQDKEDDKSMVSSEEHFIRAMDNMAAGDEWMIRLTIN